MTTENRAINDNSTKLVVAELQPLFQGRILVDGDQDYDKTRKIWNGMIDRKPAIIAQSTTPGDIIQAVKIAKKHGLLISVRGGGHNISGNAVCEGGIMIDLSQMKSVVVDAENKFAYVEMGACWSDFDKATQVHGLASTGGVISTTGVAGLTLGGGVGWLVRRFGLSCDNLLEAEVVTASGDLVKASFEENADLLWGLKGGGGNFGIVCSMKFQLHEVGTVLGGMILHTRDKAKEVLQFYREFMKTAPEELTLYAGLLNTPDGLPVVALVGCYSGDLETGEKIIKPLREFGSPIADLVQPIPYTQMQTLLDGAAPYGNRYYWKSGFMEKLSDDAIDIIVSNMALVSSPYSAVLLEYYGGASCREPRGGTAFPHRQAQFDLVIMSNWKEKEDDENNIAWTRKIWEAVVPFLSNKVYVNVLGSEGEERIHEAYGSNYPLLAELKDKYDPDNLFRMNQNIKPAKSSLVTP